jgi:mRNA-degrading endonuclease RelE of RelBE toxin-antitoxin system
MVYMAPKQRYKIIYDSEVAKHLRTIDKKYHPLIRRTIEGQLQFEPHVETRNRKPLTRPMTFSARWELQFGPQNRFRVFYRVIDDAYEVYVLAIGVKERERLYLGEEVFEL